MTSGHLEIYTTLTDVTLADHGRTCKGLARPRWPLDRKHPAIHEAGYAQRCIEGNFPIVLKRLPADIHRLA